MTERLLSRDGGPRYSGEHSDVATKFLGGTQRAESPMHRKRQRRSGTSSSSTIARIEQTLANEVSRNRATWNDLRRRHRELHQFSDAAGLIAILRASNGDLDLKDGVYRALISEVQRGGPAAALARDIAWLGLWHPLRSVLRRHAAEVQNHSAAISDVAVVVLELLHGSDLAGIQRLAATLVLNAERRIAAMRLRAAVQRQLEVGAVLPFGNREAATSDFAIVERDLARVAGADVTLLILWSIGGLTYGEIASRLELAERTVRKRISRARSKLRRHLFRTTDENRCAGFSAQHRDSFGVNAQTLLESRRCPNHWPPRTRPAATKPVGTSWYCAACADFLLAGAVRHQRGTSCLVSGEEGPGICPACLVDVFRARGELP